MIINNAKHVRLSEVLDSIVTIDITARGSIGTLYKAARAKNNNRPLCLTAVEEFINNIRPKDYVFLTTGWIDQPIIAPNYGETDGPSGTLVLARALRITLGACPIIFTDAALVEGMKRMAQAAGFHYVDPKDLVASVEMNKLMTISILPFPIGYEEAQELAVEMLDQYHPSCCIAVERGGINVAGKIHNMFGMDTSTTQAKVDYIFQEANKRNISTVGVGDGGNEIGMANIHEAIAENIRYGNQCQCPCGMGIAPSTKVKALVTSSISNWGCYALAALLAAVRQNARAIHSEKNEEELLRVAADYGFHDANYYGEVDHSVDGCESTVQYAVINLIKEATRKNWE